MQQTNLPAAWNDQSPAIGLNDLELRSRCSRSDLIVQSAAGTAWQADAVTLEACRLESRAGDARTLRVAE
jgi:hypothetical protein